MHLIDALTGRKRPSPGVPPSAAGPLRDALLGLGTGSGPCDLRTTISGEPGELVAEWTIVDARWLEAFTAAGMTKSFAVFLRLDEARHQVRALERATSLEWRAGVPAPAAIADVTWRRQMIAEAATKYGLRSDLTLGRFYSYRFRSSDLERPLWTAVLAHGWSWRAVGPGEL